MFESDRLHVESPFVRRARRPNRRVRLFCFPHAGAGASSFADWPSMLPPEVELIAVQLPGREDRVGESPFLRMEITVRTVGLALRPYLQGPCAFFGHSGGALLAFELARALRKRGMEPNHLFLSGQPAPDLPAVVPNIHGLPDEDFRKALHLLGGMSADVVNDDELMKVLLPSLRADFTLWETYRYQAQPKLSAPITALGGDADDRAPISTLEAWREHTTGAFASRVFPGGHFYLNDVGVDLTETIGSALLRRESAHAK
ncbi:alpha/beta fold hydrolase [Allokutzneria sp. A3M-2-11 16]|uniref:thioesterase II family protein n=1 Tax=Allokutzneria sp. A3M-2-11 16 TaxID=2962043 RepID=UPI0020B66E9F|nr:alpha/beta fold hydrolase [Allokutzneria sp. A3M-2-11 16]MCP3804557.1 alpha/beta fold hydrolase [Allokutzneria sp. A3M-2-11 16]